MRWIFPVFLLLVSFSYAENPGKITGCVSDDSGGFLPGVTVEISGSPMKKKVTVYTDETGCYKAEAMPTAVRSETLALKPLLRPGELLEEVPGVVISQHSGQGKANQDNFRKVLSYPI